MHLLSETAHKFSSRFFQNQKHALFKNEVLAYTVINPSTEKVIAGGFTELNIDDIFFNPKDMQMLALADGKTILYHKELRFIASLNADYSKLTSLSKKSWLSSIGIDKPITKIYFNSQHQANVNFIDGTTQTLDLAKNLELLPAITRHPKNKNQHYSAYWQRIGNSARYNLSVSHKTPRGYSTRKNYQETILLKPRIKARLDQGMLTTSVEDLSEQAKHKLSFVSLDGNVLWELANLRFETVINNHPRTSSDYTVLETDTQFIVFAKNPQNILGLMAINKNTGSTLWRYTVPHHP